MLIISLLMRYYILCIWVVTLMLLFYTTVALIKTLLYNKLLSKLQHEFHYSIHLLFKPMYIVIK